MLFYKGDLCPMGKYAYKEKKLKSLKRGAFYPLMAVNCMIVGLVSLFALLSVIGNIQAGSDSLETKPFLLNPLPLMLVGLGLFVVFGAIEMLCKLRWEMKWFDFFIAGYVISGVIWGILSLVALSNWWSNRNSDDAIVLRWLTLVMLIYWVVAAVIRIIVHFIAVWIDKKSIPGGSKRIKK